MLQPTLTRRAEDALQALDRASSLLSLLGALDAVYTQVDTRLLAIAEGTSLQENANSAHSQMASLPRITKEISARNLFREIESLELRLSSALAEGLDEPKYILEPIGTLDEFADAYNNYVVHQAGVNALPLLLVARRLKQTLANLRSFLTHISANASGLSSAGEDEAVFSMILLNVTDLQDFAKKLGALSELYAEICYVLGVSVASHPLRIGKIESGSLWTRLFGDTRAVGLMLTLVESSVRYFHRNYTTEGKIAAIPKRIESLDAILQFSSRLKESGVDVTTLNESLAKNAASIADSLNELVSNQPVVELNGQVLSVHADIEKRLLQFVSTPKLTYDSAGAVGTPDTPSTE
ncbi:hypothetical protein HZU83_15630 [Sphaerotilus montanus]|uniref:Uncharacterized protein n=1 Tax=Sphaerotilus montanus TaxID=522889 RepID=A0A7Y9U7P2_9BURK|nr:hypothetical protein [Sphaerotilus montanus]NYG35353.1 hypothetical protein [Sphaerotilus montanus]NZD58124.1 hypothetical protein [Sphaerotilus montanus]